MDRSQDTNVRVGSTTCRYKQLASHEAPHLSTRTPRQTVMPRCASALQFCSPRGPRLTAKAYPLFHLPCPHLKGACVPEAGGQCLHREVWGERRWRLPVPPPPSREGSSHPFGSQMLCEAGGSSRPQRRDPGGRGGGWCAVRTAAEALIWPMLFVKTILFHVHVCDLQAHSHL